MEHKIVTDNKVSIDMNNSSEVRHISDIKELLKEGKVQFIYLKANGEFRLANGTLNLDIIPDDSHPKGLVKRKRPDYCISYYDFDKCGWRSFDINYIIWDEVNGLICPEMIDEKVIFKFEEEYDIDILHNKKKLVSSFNIMQYDINSKDIKPYDIIPYLKECCEKENISKYISDEGLKEFILDNSRYRWHLRSQYEMLACHPYIDDFDDLVKDAKKIDIYYQVKMNIDVIVSIMKDIFR